MSRGRRGDRRASRRRRARSRCRGSCAAFEALARQAREETLDARGLPARGALRRADPSRTESAVRQRLREARFPELKTLDTFDFTAADGVDAAQIAELARGEWIANAENVILAGPIGTGKTHLAIALGIEAARQRRRVALLPRRRPRARPARGSRRPRAQAPPAPPQRVDLLILDELGFVPFDRAGGELLFNVARRPLRAPSVARHHQPRASASGPRSSAATRSSPPRCSTASPTGDGHHDQGEELPHAPERSRLGRKGAPSLAALAQAHDMTDNDDETGQRERRRSVRLLKPPPRGG